MASDRRRWRRKRPTSCVTYSRSFLGSPLLPTTPEAPEGRLMLPAVDACRGGSAALVTHLHAGSSTVTAVWRAGAGAPDGSAVFYFNQRDAASLRDAAPRVRCTRSMSVSEAVHRAAPAVPCDAPPTYADALGMPTLARGAGQGARAATGDSPPARAGATPTPTPTHQHRNPPEVQPSERGRLLGVTAGPRPQSYDSTGWRTPPRVSVDRPVHADSGDGLTCSEGLHSADPASSGEMWAGPQCVRQGPDSLTYSESLHSADLANSGEVCTSGPQCVRQGPDSLICRASNTEIWTGPHCVRQGPDSLTCSESLHSADLANSGEVWTEPHCIRQGPDSLICNEGQHNADSLVCRASNTEIWTGPQCIRQGPDSLTCDEIQHSTDRSVCVYGQHGADRASNSEIRTGPQCVRQEPDSLICSQSQHSADSPVCRACNTEIWTGPRYVRQEPDSLTCSESQHSTDWANNSGETGSVRQCVGQRPDRRGEAPHQQHAFTGCEWDRGVHGTATLPYQPTGRSGHALPPLSPPHCPTPDANPFGVSSPDDLFPPAETPSPGPSLQQGAGNLAAADRPEPYNTEGWCGSGASTACRAESRIPLRLPSVVPPCRTLSDEDEEDEEEEEEEEEDTFPGLDSGSVASRTGSACSLEGLDSPPPQEGQSDGRDTDSPSSLLSSPDPSSPREMLRGRGGRGRGRGVPLEAGPSVAGLPPSRSCHRSSRCMETSL